MLRKYGVKNIIATVTLLGILLIVIFYTEPESAFPDDYFNTTSLLETYALTEKNATTPEPETQPPKCEPNMNAENVSNFGSLSNQIQDFLYYRHCRSFPIILDLPHKCGRPDKPKDIFLLLVIKSPPNNFEHREVLRKTWAKERSHNGKKIQTIFISGTDGYGYDKERLNKLLALEHKQHGDILQWNFKESLFNLTLKQILFLEWMNRRCPHACFLLNGDDDVFAHTDNMVEYLQSLEDNNGTKHLFTGQVIENAGPIRWPQSKYFVPLQVYDGNSYPAYCGGAGYLMSGYTASVIYEKSKSVEILPIDDVYMGMCLDAAKLKPTTHMGVSTLGWYIPSRTVDKYHPCFLKEVLVIHKFSPASLYILWHEVHNPKIKCGTQLLK
uniref:Hexosyltransferase n=2 Tax=Nothobranchius furzeri TaxID=105023 RepID=A0A8C6LPK7_NOTFU